jgi:hypothetical protein
VDALKRGILITPGSAPAEAVRSYLEYGYDLRCIDASLPVAGSISEYEYFIQLCRLHGPGKVIESPEQFGFSKEDIFQAWAGSVVGSLSTMPAFMGISRILTPEDCPPFDRSRILPYQYARLQCMAMHLAGLLRSGPEILFVCRWEQVNGILSLLQTDLPAFDDSYRLPVRICNVPETALPSLSREIPFMTHAYEQNRDLPFDREYHLMRLFTGTLGVAPPQHIIRTMKYAGHLALADYQVYPGLYNLVAAAKYCMGDAIAMKVHENATAYPPSRELESNCPFRSIVDYNFNPLAEERVLTLKTNMLDKPLPNLNRGQQSKNLRTYYYYRFTRTERSLAAEKELMQYLRSRFRSPHRNGRDSQPVPFMAGLQSGIDYRQTLRNLHLGKMFVKQPVPEENCCYILDYRPEAQVPRAEAENPSGTSRFVIRDIMPEGSLTHVFLDKHFPWIGITLHKGNHYTSKIMVAFTCLPFSPTKIFENISRLNPLTSSVSLALKYAREVFVFSNRNGELKGQKNPGGRVHAYSMNVLPEQVREKMQTFEIVGYRYDDRPGD